MVYWKLDDETIRCLINKDEIRQMGFDLTDLTQDASVMTDFLEMIIDESHKYIEWNTENGIQNYIAKALPADQFLITISCTFKDEAINQDLEQILRVYNAMNKKVTAERIQKIAELTGEEKEEAFAALSRDLQNVCLGKVTDEETSGQSDRQDQKTSDAAASSMTASSTAGVTSRADDKQKKDDHLPPQKITFHSMEALMEFAGLLPANYNFASSLYRLQGEYVLLIDFEDAQNNVDVITFLITAEEYDADCKPQGLSRYYIQEHGQLLIAEQAIAVLRSMS